MSALDLDAIEAEWLRQCGSCDAGLPVSCVCTPRDERVPMSALVARVRELEAVVERVEALETAAHDEYLAAASESRWPEQSIGEHMAWEAKKREAIRWRSRITAALNGATS